MYPWHRNPSQAERRARKWRERPKGAVEFIHRVFDLQLLARGDQAMAELPFVETCGVQSLVEGMIKRQTGRVTCETCG